MLDTINTDTTQDNARALGGLFAGKQIVNMRTTAQGRATIPTNLIAFTDGTTITVQAATILPGGDTINADNATLDVDLDNFTNSDNDHYDGKYDSGRIVRAWVETTSEFTDTNGMSVPQVERTITLWALAENNLRPEKIAETSGEYAAHSDMRPTLILEANDGTIINAADAALNAQW